MDETKSRNKYKMKSRSKMQETAKQNTNKITIRDVRLEDYVYMVYINNSNNWTKAKKNIEWKSKLIYFKYRLAQI